MSRFVRDLEVKAGRAAARAHYSSVRGERPYSLSQARHWATSRLIDARNAHATMMLNPDGGRGRAFNQRRADRLERIHQGAQRALHAWEGSRRAPAGFRRGVAAANQVGGRSTAKRKRRTRRAA